MKLTRFHYRLGLIVAAGLLVDSVDVYVTAGVSAALVREGVVDLADVGRLAMTTTLFLAVGGLLAGFLADRFGRVAMMRMTMAVVVAGGLGAALAPSFDAVVAWRALTALGLGGETVLAYGVLTEFMPPNLRGRCMAAVGLLSSFALPLSLSLGVVILPMPEGWRWLIAVPSAAGIIIFILRFFLPESPRWLAGRGRMSEADAIVATVEATSRGPLEPPVTATSQPVSPPSADESQIWRRFLAASAIHIATMSAVYGFVSWLPTFFAAAGHSIATSSLFSTLMTLGAPAGTLIALLITDHVERKWAVIGAALAAAVLGGAYAIASGPAAILGLGFLVVAAIYCSATLGLFSYVPELFPTRLRLGAIGLVSTLGRATAFGLPLLIVPLFSSAGQAGVVGLVVALLLGEALVVACFGPRTKSRSLEQV